MRVPSNSASEKVLLGIQKLANRQAQLQNQAATGQRISSPSDDPAAVARVLMMQSEKSQIAQYQRNADTALEVSQASYSGLNAMKKISDRAGEIATLGTGTASADSFAAYASEVDQLLEQALQTGNTKFRNDYLFAGTAVDSAPYTVTRDPVSGKITAVTYAGNSTQSSVQVSETSSISPGTTGATNTGLKDLIANLISLRDALAAADSNAVTTTRTALESSENVLVNGLSEQGAVQLRIEINQQQQATRNDDLDNLISSEVDADLADTVVRLSQTSTAYEAALSSATKILKMSLLDYLS